MLKRRTKIVLILAGLVVAVGWLAWPYYALYDLITAVKNGDAVALEERVAWDSVRQGLRGDLSAFLLQKLSADAKARNNDAGAVLGAGLAAAFGPAIINQLIDSYVTPQTISTLIRTGKPSVPIGGTPTADTSGEQKHQPDLKLVRFAFFSGGPFTFKVEIAPEGGSVQKELGLLFKWSGDWKLTRIILPADAMDAFQSARRVTPSAESVRTKTAFSTVVVAAVPLTFGTTLNRENVAEIPWASSKMPEGAYATRDELFKDGRRVALAPLQRNELILKTKITGPGATTLTRAGAEETDLSTTLKRSQELRKAGNYPAALVEAQKLEAAEARLGTDTTNYAVALNNLANVYKAQDNYGEAERLYQRALSIMKKAVGENHLNVVDILNNLTALYQAQGKEAEAERHYKDALAIQAAIAKQERGAKPESERQPPRPQAHSAGGAIR